MGHDWPVVKLKSLYKIPSRNGLTKPKKIRGSGYKFINMGEIFAYSRMMDIPCDRVPMTDKEKNNSFLEDGDLLFARQSLVLSGAGKCAIFLGDGEQVTFESHLIRVRLDKEVVNPEYAFYYFNSPQGRANIATIVEQGAGQAGIRGSDLENLDFPLPPKDAQDFIADMVRPTDIKIEVNQETNQTLEAMAQALFKSWFVDFDPVIDNALAAGHDIPPELQARAEARKSLQARAEQRQASLSGDRSEQESGDILPESIRQLFPNRFVLDAQMGWIPEGWKTTQLDQLIKLTGGGTPKTTTTEYWDGDIPWFSVVDAPSDSDVFVIDTEKHITQLGIDNSSTKLLRVGTTIISARGTVGKCAMVATPMAMNQSCYAINGADGVADEFIYYMIRYQVSGLQQRSHGSVFSTITRDTFKSIAVPFSGAELTVCFSELVKPLFDKVLANSKSEIQLTKLRDTLLPKLISGELRLPDEQQPAKTVTA